MLSQKFFDAVYFERKARDIVCAVCMWLCVEIVSWQYVFAAVMNVKADTYTEQQKMCLKYVHRCLTLEYIFAFIYLINPQLIVLQLWSGLPLGYGQVAGCLS
jgi:hypothetical protein